MASIKEYNIKLRSLTNTQKITKTMKMVSASKLRKAHQAQANAKLYAQNVTALTSRIAASVESGLHPLLTPKKEVKKALILILTSNKGLCGAFNQNAIKQVLKWLETHRNNYQHIEVTCCGKKGFQSLKRRMTVKKFYDQTSSDPKFEDAMTIGQDLSGYFINGDYDEIFIVYNQFFSPLSQKAIFEKILPIDPQSLMHEKIENPREYIFEPQPAELLAFLIPHFLYFKIYFAMLENWAGEHGARMTAMDNATKNASEMIELYTLLRNRARQEQITTELIEIIAGAEALK